MRKIILCFLLALYACAPTVSTYNQSGGVTAGSVGTVNIYGPVARHIGAEQWQIFASVINPGTKIFVNSIGSTREPWRFSYELASGLSKAKAVVTLSPSGNTAVPAPEGIRVFYNDSNPKGAAVFRALEQAGLHPEHPATNSPMGYDAVIMVGEDAR